MYLIPWSYSPAPENMTGRLMGAGVPKESHLVFDGIVVKEAGAGVEMTARSAGAGPVGELRAGVAPEIQVESAVDLTEASPDFSASWYSASAVASGRPAVDSPSGPVGLVCLCMSARRNQGSNADRLDPYRV